MYQETKQIAYKKGYKYQTQEIAIFQMNSLVGITIDTKYLQVVPEGYLIIREGYAWDGASGAIDTDSIMRGALFHDACYQLMRAGLLADYQKTFIDNKFHQYCIEDGMFTIRAMYVLQAVEAFGHDSTLPETIKEVLHAPLRLQNE